MVLLTLWLVSTVLIIPIAGRLMAAAIIVMIIIVVTTIVVVIIVDGRIVLLWLFRGELSRSAV